jgi:protein-S-isoprenylcysteine O-methyltransferase Ste14
MRPQLKLFLNHLPHLFYTHAFRWIGRKRGEVSAAIAVISLIDVVWGNTQSIDLLEPSLSALFTVSWILLIAGVAIRIWAAGNLQKNTEITMGGIYRMVRHPLYLSTVLIYLAYFLACGDAALGVILFLGMIVIIYWPRIMHEEGALQKKFPGQTGQYRDIPRLFPNPFLLRVALTSDRFSLRRAYRNLGMRTIGVVLFIPALLEMFVQLKMGH